MIKGKLFSCVTHTYILTMMIEHNDDDDYDVSDVDNDDEYDEDDNDYQQS